MQCLKQCVSTGCLCLSEHKDKHSDHTPCLLSGMLRHASMGNFMTMINPNLSQQTGISILENIHSKIFPNSNQSQIKRFASLIYRHNLPDTKTKWLPIIKESQCEKIFHILIHRFLNRSVYHFESCIFKCKMICWTENHAACTQNTHVDCAIDIILARLNMFSIMMMYVLHLIDISKTKSKTNNSETQSKKRKRSACREQRKEKQIKIHV